MPSTIASFANRLSDAVAAFPARYDALLKQVVSWDNYDGESTSGSRRDA